MGVRVASMAAATGRALRTVSTGARRTAWPSEGGPGATSRSPRARAALLATSGNRFSSAGVLELENQVGDPFASGRISARCLSRHRALARGPTGTGAAPANRPSGVGRCCQRKR